MAAKKKLGLLSDHGEYRDILVKITRYHVNHIRLKISCHSMKTSCHYWKN